MNNEVKRSLPIGSFSFPVDIVGDGVVLAGQPQASEWWLLAQHGFRTVLNIRTDPARADVQAHVLEVSGLRQVYLPMPRQPEPADLDAFVEVVEQSRDEGLIIHCRTASRTAFLWMLYRMVHQGWSEQQARDELLHAGYESEQVDHFLEFVHDYVRRTGHSAGQQSQRRAA
jgi:uncharacterized protein (TIGR01244 family)